MFDAPATATGATLKPAEIEGHLLVVVPEEFVAQMQTSMGTSDAIRVTVHDITTQTSTEGALWFNKVLVNSLKNMIGRQVLAMMGRGTAKAGQSAPYILIDASKSPEAVAAATAYINARTAQQLTAPAPAAAPVAAAPAPVNDPAANLANALAALGATVVSN